MKRLNARRRARVVTKINKPQPSASRPFVVVNMAMTADGKIATANRAVSSFGSPADQKELLKLRATADAVIAGARTVDLNRVTMGPGGAAYQKLRVTRGLSEYNLRIIVSRLASVDPHAAIFRRKLSPVIVLASGKAPAARLAKLRVVASAVEVFGRERIDLLSALCWLMAKWGVKRLICEGGGELNDALFRAGLVDELHLTICPQLFGGRKAPTICDGEGAATLAAAVPMKLKSARRVGDELFLVYVREGSPARRGSQPRARAAKANRKGG